MKILRLASTTLVVGVVGCSLPLIGRGSSTTATARQADDSDTVAVAPAVVQVRAFQNASVVSVVAWDTDDAAFGLRTSVTQSGELVGGVRFGDHRLYMTPLYAHEMGGFKYATVTVGQLLVAAGAQRDEYACFYGKDCSPFATVGVRVPDSLLRASHDSLVVTFHPRVFEQWTITLHRELIAAYLAKVDSVVAEARKRQAI